MEKLVNGKEYWLGAVYGTYKEDEDIFILGNGWVHRNNTIYCDPEVSKWVRR